MQQNVIRVDLLILFLAILTAYSWVRLAWHDPAGRLTDGEASATIGEIVT
ncbi:MAG TPA: hypothetical protein PLO62_01570 [Candidatus Hydrogenedentes bacterium]|nr:hypothetical protein [Candidatus Hydrogenedentota bacterium]HOS01460.1 hypothetical protein [Candidatus Hydrogenedentota bacterium]